MYRDLRPILSPEDAMNIQKLVKDQKSRLKPYLKRYSGGVLDDPLLKKWEKEDSHRKVSLHLSHRDCGWAIADDLERYSTNQTSPNPYPSTGGIRSLLP